MPQETTVQCFDSSGNSIPCDSMSENVRGVVDSIIHSIEVQPYTTKQENKDDSIFPFMILFVFIILIISAVKNAKKQDEEEEAKDAGKRDYAPGNNQNRHLVYNGWDLNFADEELRHILDKHFIYYTKINEADKAKFIHRLKNFIKDKIFVIHDESGFKEMPILISASAVQISFGLDKYLLPFFSHIHIFPEEFIGYHPTLRLLEGNVSGHTVNLSWKHFFNGYKLPDNGQNVGLHEFAHAFYYQYFEVKENVERDFVETFPLFDACGNKAFEMEQAGFNKLYSDYALRNFQEFWAESVEIFFERPADMKKKYADLYEAVCDLLNQNPLNNNSGIA